MLKSWIDKMSSNNIFIFISHSYTKFSWKQSKPNIHKTEKCLHMPSFFVSIALYALGIHNKELVKNYIRQESTTSIFARHTLKN